MGDNSSTTVYPGIPIQTNEGPMLRLRSFFPISLYFPVFFFREFTQFYSRCEGKD